MDRDIADCEVRMIEKILKMLEDPESENKEINARIYAFLRLHDNFNVYIHEGGGSVTYRHNSWTEDNQSVLYHLFDMHNYTTSLDAAMSIGAEELEGWAMTIESVLVTETVGDVDMPSKIMWDADIDKDGAGFGMNAGLTAPRAICHARIQALEYLRREE